MQPGGGQLRLPSRKCRVSAPVEEWEDARGRKGLGLARNKGQEAGSMGCGDVVAGRGLPGLELDPGRLPCGCRGACPRQPWESASRPDARPSLARLPRPVLQTDGRGVLGRRWMPVPRPGVLVSLRPGSSPGSQQVAAHVPGPCHSPGDSEELPAPGFQLAQPRLLGHFGGEPPLALQHSPGGAAREPRPLPVLAVRLSQHTVVTCPAWLPPGRPTTRVPHAESAGRHAA